VGAAVLLWVVPIPLAVRLIGFGLIGTSAWLQIRQHGLRRGSRAIQSIDTPEDVVQPITLSTFEKHISCRPKAIYVQSSLVLVQLKCSGTRLPRTLLIMADALEPDAFRRLRVYLLRRTPAV